MYRYHVCIFLSHFPNSNLIEDEIYKEFLYFHKNNEIIYFKINDINYVHSLLKNNVLWQSLSIKIISFMNNIY